MSELVTALKPIDHLKRAIEMFGSQTELARAAGVTQPAISNALRLGSVGPMLAVKVHAATGGAIDRADLCPAVFGTVASA